MNAKEARQQTLWNRLPLTLRGCIVERVNNGLSDCCLNYELYDETKKILTKLGYFITFNGSTTRIKW